ncbi:MAG: amidohydrolase family protein, partial [Billgrantia desiderata]
TWSEPHPEQAKRTLQAIATEWGISLHEAAARLQPAGAVYHNMHEDDMRRVLAHPLSMVGSDGLPNDPHPHPRLWGAFPRVLARYSRDLGLMPLTEAVRKMTGLSAANFGLDERGVIRQGAYADLTLFDLDNLEDVADFARPIAPARGIALVMVNGVIGYRDGQASGGRAGRMLRRTQRLTHHQEERP